MITLHIAIERVLAALYVIGMHRIAFFAPFVAFLIAKREESYFLRNKAWLFFTFIIGSGVLSVLSLQDISWDLRNYHFYNPFAFLAHKVGVNIEVAQIQTYINPLLDMPHYFLIRYLPPIVTGFVIGAIQGINLILIFLIAEIIFKKIEFHQRGLLAFTATVAGFFGAANLAEIGSLYGDNMVSIPILGALYVIMRCRFTKEITDRSVSVVIAGFLLGAAIGLKLWAAIFFPGLFVIVIFLYSSSIGSFIRNSALFCTMIVIGLCTTIGFWSWKMYVLYKSPFFPFFNSIFQSDYYDSHFFWGVRSLVPTNAISALTYPFQFVLPVLREGEIPFIDARYPFLFGLIILGTALIIGKNLNKEKFFSFFTRLKIGATQLLPFQALLVFFVVSFVTWEFMIGVYRYAVVLEFLTPLLILSVALLIITCRRARLFVCIGLISILAISTTPTNNERIMWTDSYFNVQLPRSIDLSNSQVLIAGQEPIAYVVPYFPESTQTIRIQGNFFDPTKDTGLNRLIKSKFQENRIRYIMFLENALKDESVNSLLSIYGLSANLETCEYIVTKIERLKLCRVTRS